ncbi:hypothetical protein HanXRQr2_Chr10g0453861 [Helianthus annuus]|uniref:Uncharacterized protein n=1 Tax=Helianthus annuus TaxID=4232 RepID=A0A9K3HZW8_HELAN|nr:hypothetical protein HanXRQr2_Chr10g0453861 [Helianthus annuus]KAJ0884800.1 hypothetical protein HanPSC8_Chr10g0438051 [Helianthus annuus]
MRIIQTIFNSNQSHNCTKNQEIKNPQNIFIIKVKNRGFFQERLDQNLQDYELHNKNRE